MDETMITLKKKNFWFKFLTKVFIFFFVGLITIQSRTHSPPAVPTDPFSMMHHGEAQAKMMDQSEMQQKTATLSMMARNKDKAVEWLYNKTTRVPKTLANEYVNFIVENIEPQLQPLILVLMTVESEGNPFAKSPKGAIGITQIVPKYWENELVSQGIINEARDLYDFRKNILCSQYILKSFFEGGHSLKSVLVQYSGYRSNYYEKVQLRLNDFTNHISTAVNHKGNRKKLK